MGVSKVKSESHNLSKNDHDDVSTTTESVDEENDESTSEDRIKLADLTESKTEMSISLISSSGEHDGKNVSSIPYVGVGGMEVTDRVETSPRTHNCRGECYGHKALISDHSDGDAVGPKSVMTPTEGENVHGHPKGETGTYCSACALLPDLLGRRYILPVLAEATLETDDDANADTCDEDTKTDAHRVLGVGG